EDGDGDLNALHGRVQILGHVRDHHVHVRAREAADELGQRERNEHLSQRTRRPVDTYPVSHAVPTLSRVGTERANWGSTLSEVFTWQSAGLLDPIGELRFVELVVLVDVEV